MTLLSLGSLLLLVWCVSGLIAHPVSAPHQVYAASESLTESVAETPLPPAVLPAPTTIVHYRYAVYHWREDCPLIARRSRRYVWQGFAASTRAQAQTYELRPCYYCSHPTAIVARRDAEAELMSQMTK
ncbi:MAG: hypothetical protein JO316_08950 [Abitibacteriaceae bacterium]|nr:hypothetical protein [Abditibacteriaceae bacterium]MBV9865463.1 hypothetical protein [Abditibacteriaceae bacterium]